MAWSALQFVLLWILLHPAADLSKDDKSKQDRKAEPIGTVLQIARSEDGRQFEEAAQVLLRGARSPSVVRLDNGDLLAVFEQSGEKSGETVLAATRSGDDGKTWLPARPVRLAGLSERSRIESPTLVVMPSGLVRMYFGIRDDKPDRKRGPRSTTIHSAVTRNGVEYQLDRQVRIPCEGLESLRLTAFRTDKQVILLAGSAPGADKHSSSSRAVAQQYASSNGRSFTRPERARFAGAVGPVVRIDRHHWRMYVAGEGDIRSRMSNDGSRWRDESGACLKGSVDAAVTPTSDKKYLMLLGTTATPEAAKLPELAAARPAKGAGPVNGGAPEQRDAADGQPAAQKAAETKTDSAQAEAVWDAFASGGFEAELGADWGPGSGAAGGANAASGDGEDLAPLPDFQNHFDYVGWFVDHAIVPDGENAYYSYVPVLEGLPAREEKINDMFNDPEPGLLPGPWNPADRPVWEESYQATQDLMAQYATAARDPRAFSSPANFGDCAPEDRMLWSLLLPSLATMRPACKATLGQAWRAVDGIVPPEQMRTAIETVIGNANHLRQGPTLIERLVGIAERNMAHQNARWALQHGVFNSADELEATLGVLRDSDTADPDPGGWARFEHAAAMDVVQYLFQPTEPGGEPKAQPDRLQRLGLMSSGDSVSQNLEAVGQMTAEDASASAESMADYYQRLTDHFRDKFPYQSADYLEQVAIEKGSENALAKLMLPSLARASEMLRRAEADRRATQLVYNVHLFRARNGRYPASLAEIPPDQIDDVRLDPYSGQDFAYRLTDAGPTVYSLSNNGVDDGGVHSKRWGDDREGQSDDYVFWPPQP